MKLRFRATSQDIKVWLSSQGEPVWVRDHVEDVRKLVDFELDPGRDIYNQVLDRGWIRMGAGQGQTWISARKFDRESLAMIQMFLMKHSEMLQKNVVIEVEDDDGEGDRWWGGSSEDFLLLKRLPRP